MKPMNFPEKKNQRRKKALERMLRSKNKNEKAIENTRSKIVDNARGHRTKKSRGKGK